MSRNDRLQALCRHYLSRLRSIACSHGLGVFVDDTIAANKRKECEATEKEVELLARCVDEERMSRGEIPKVLGKSYRRCCEDGDFDAIRRLRRVGVYSTVSVLLHKKPKNICEVWE